MNAVEREQMEEQQVACGVEVGTAGAVHRSPRPPQCCVEVIMSSAETRPQPSFLLDEPSAFGAPQTPRDGLGLVDGTQPLRRNRPALVRHVDGRSLPYRLGPTDRSLAKPEANAWQAIEHYLVLRRRTR